MTIVDTDVVIDFDRLLGHSSNLSQVRAIHSVLSRVMIHNVFVALSLVSVQAPSERRSLIDETIFTSVIAISLSQYEQIWLLQITLNVLVYSKVALLGLKSWVTSLDAKVSVHQAIVSWMSCKCFTILLIEKIATFEALS